MSAARSESGSEPRFSEVPQVAPQPLERYLISPFWDLFLVGGCSLGMFLLANLFFKNETPDSSVAWFVFNLSYIVNFPHFLVSYQILYNDFRGHIFKEFRFFWAAVLAPLLLVGILAFAFLGKAPMVLGYMVNAMYFFVGWHYVKQIFGCISVSNAINRYFYTPTERAILKTNLFSLWGLSYVAQNQGAQSYRMEGVNYLTFNFPPSLIGIAMGWVIFSGVLVAVVHVQKYIREGRVPSRTAIAAFLTIYVWYIPTLYHPMFFHMIPFFHSLQYMLFVYSFRRNKVDLQFADHGTESYRKGWVLGVVGYLGLAVVTGALSFRVIPLLIDSTHWADPTLFGPTAAVFAVTIFINIHHYFIDNVIWRAKNPEMKKYLFAAHTPGSERPSQRAA